MLFVRGKMVGTEMRVDFRHFLPEELNEVELSTGVLLDAEIPEPQPISGKHFVLYVDPTTKAQRYSAEDIPLTEEQKVMKSLRDENEKLKAEAAVTNQTVSDFMDYVFQAFPELA